MYLQESIPGEDEWETIQIFEGTIGTILSTPDPLMDLRVEPHILTGTAKFYFAP
jgi:hypothetical protein